MDNFFRRRFDSQPNAAAVNSEHDDIDFSIREDNLFADSPTEY